MPRRQPATRTTGRNNGASSSSTALSSLPLEVRNALRQLPSATERLAKGAADDAASPIALLSRGERRAVEQLLTSLMEGHEHSDGISAETTAALLSMRPVQLALLHLALASLRVTPGELREGKTRDCGRVQARALALTHALLHPATREGSLPQAACFIRALLRTQALQAASRQLAALVEALLAVPAAVAGTHRGKGQGQEQQDGEQQQEQQQQGRESDKDTVFVEDVIVSLSYVVLFVYDVVHWAAKLEDALCVELAAALHDSGALEHTGRGLLLVLPLVGRSSGLGDVCSQGTSSALLMSTYAHTVAAGRLLGRLKSSALPDAPAAASQLRAALSGRCMQTAALSVGVATLCAADGGSAHGLPCDLLAALPVKAHVGAGGTWQGGLPQVRATAFEAVLRLLRLQLRAQPPGRRGALLLALRIGRLGMTSAVAAAAAEEEARAAGRGGSAGAGGIGSNSSGSGGGSHVHLQQQLQEGCARPRMVVAADATASLCCVALVVSRELLQRAPPGSAHWRADAEEWWRLAVAAVRHTLRYARKEGGQQLLCDLLAWAADEKIWTVKGQPLCLSPEPPAVIAAALGGGLLPCLERLMRRAGQEPQGPEAAVLRLLLLTGSNVPWRYLAPLLAYGDPRQAAALVATFGKLLRAIDPSDALAAAWEPDSNTQYLDVWVTGKALLGISSLVADMAPQPREGGFASIQQLARLMSLGACEWLPTLSRLAFSAMQAALQRRRVQRLLSELLTLSLPTLLLWLPLLTGQYSAQGTASPAAEAAGGMGAATGAPGLAAGGAPLGAGRASWRSLVLEEVGAVPLLGTALELAAAEHPLRQSLVLRLLVDSCCAVVDMLATPGGCLGTALAAAAGVPPSDSSSAAAATGSSGAGHEPADSGEGAAVACLPWRPERAVAARLRAKGGEDARAADAAEGLADELEGRHGAEAGAGSHPAATDRQWRPEVHRLLRDALVPPAEARRLLRTCGNPGCTNLAGDSEAELPLQACSRCGAVGYCCRACQVAHWRAGHGAACKGREKGGENC